MLEFFLIKTLTLKPFFKANLVMAEPRKPLAPVTRIFLTFNKKVD